MSEKLLPFNIDILQVTDQLTNGITPVTVLDVFDPATKNFNENGLFSASIFGKVGSKERMRRFSFIQLNTKIIHPIIYKAIIELKGFYEDIFKGTQYAIFNTTTKEFEKSTPVEGTTGYSFFVKHLPELKFSTTESSKRDLKIDLVEKYKDKCFTDKIIIIPAGLRDFVIDENGKPSEDEVNTYYRQFLSKNSLLSKSIMRSSQQNLDDIIYSLQKTFNELYLYFKSLLSGKNKLILGKWASRRIYNSTRNVISAPIIKINELDNENNIRVDNTQVGLYQYMKATLPITIHKLRDGYLNEVFHGDGNSANLVNMKTLKGESVTLNSNEITKWLTDAGLEKLITGFSIRVARDLPVIIMDHYFGLIYKNKDKYCFITSIEQANPEWDKNDIHPMTYAELYYLSIFDDVKNHPAFVTRYPITGMGSIYATYVYLRTTMNASKRVEIDSSNNATGRIAYEYPLIGDAYFDTIAPSPVHLARLDAD
jgi:hypothetical protein